MDDFLLFSNSKIDLKNMLNSIESFCLNNLLLTLKPYILGKCKDGIAFLGYKIHRTCKMFVFYLIFLNCCQVNSYFFYPKIQKIARKI